jgi:hypothetical protein
MFNQFNVQDKWYTYTDKIMSVSGELFVENDVDISGNLQVSNNVDISGNLDVNGDASFENVDFNGHVNIAGDVDITSGSLVLSKTNSITTGYVDMWNYIKMGLTGTADDQCVRFYTFNNHDSSTTRRGFAIKIQNYHILSSYLAYGYQIYTSISGYNSSSDDRLKFNETSITNALSTIRKLNPVTYDKSQTLNEEVNTKHRSGFIAQEVYAIEELKHIAVVGSETCEWGLFYEDIFTHSVAATKELDSIVQTQQTEINTLKVENTLLKSKLNEILSEMGKETI